MTEEVQEALNLATRDELFNELKKRYTACVLIYEEALKNKDDILVDMDWDGSRAHIKGLIQFADILINKYLDQLFEESLSD